MLKLNLRNKSLVIKYSAPLIKEEKRRTASSYLGSLLICWASYFSEQCSLEKRKCFLLIYIESSEEKHAFHCCYRAYDVNFHSYNDFILTNSLQYSGVFSRAWGLRSN